MRTRVYSGAPWEKTVAYSRATRVGNLIFVAGTTAVDEHGEIVADSMFGQADYVFQRISRALSECGASLKNVVRTRSFIRDMSKFDEFAAAHRKHFEGIDPVASCVQISALVDPALLIEIEVDAVLDE